MTNRREYHEYMASREWALKKREVRKRSKRICERCSSPAQQVDHLTYERLGHELLEDLIDVCRPCHEFRSGVRDDDPVIVHNHKEPTVDDDADQDKTLHSLDECRRIEPALFYLADEFAKANEIDKKKIEQNEKWFHYYEEKAEEMEMSLEASSAARKTTYDAAVQAMFVCMKDATIIKEAIETMLSVTCDECSERWEEFFAPGLLASQETVIQFLQNAYEHVKRDNL